MKKILHEVVSAFCTHYAGLEAINKLTNINERRQELRIDLVDIKGHHGYALYDDFVVGNEIEKFKLKSVGNYSGNAG